MAEEVTLCLDGGDHADPGLPLDLTFRIACAEWIEPDHLPTLGHWHGCAHLTKAEVLGAPLDLARVIAFLGRDWVRNLQGLAFDQWADAEPSPKQAAAQRREDERKHDV